MCGQLCQARHLAHDPQSRDPPSVHDPSPLAFAAILMNMSHMSRILSTSCTASSVSTPTQPKPHLYFWAFRLALALFPEQRG